MGIVIPTTLETLPLSMTREVAEKLLCQIKPIRTFSEGRYFIKSPDLFSKDFLWFAEKGKKANRLKALVEISTRHRILHKDQFKPSMVEVFAQIPSDLIDTVVAFEIIPISWQMTHDISGINKHSEMEAGFHVGVTKLYVRS